MSDIKGWIEGVSDEAAGLAKRGIGELTARPDVVLDGERQQAQGRSEVAAAQGQGDDHSATAIGWKLDPAARAALLAHFPPRYALTVADHVTLAAGLSSDTPLPPSFSAEVVGRADDGDGVEVLIAAIDGRCERPDGGIFHITWSLAPGRKAAESNEVIARLGWTPLPERQPVAVYPARF